MSDSSGEAFYIRDEERHHVVASPLSSGNDAFVTRHGFGYSVFEHTERGIRSEMWVYVTLVSPLKFTVLKVRNESGDPAGSPLPDMPEWVLGRPAAKIEHARDHRN